MKKNHKVKIALPLSSSAAIHLDTKVKPFSSNVVSSDFAEQPNRGQVCKFDIRWLRVIPSIKKATSKGDYSNAFIIDVH